MKEEKKRVDAVRVNLLEGQLSKYIEEITKKDAMLAQKIKQNEELLEKIKAGGLNFAEKIITIERFKTKIVEKAVEVDRVVREVDPSMKAKLTEEMRRKLKEDVRAEFKDHIKELEANVLAY